MNSPTRLLFFDITAFLIRRLRMLPLQIIFLVLAISIALPAQGTAQDAISPDRALHFSAGWRVNESSPQNLLQLGIVFRCAAAWCVTYDEFPGKDNLPRTPLAYRHEMAAPYGNHRCTDEYLTTINGVHHSDLSAQVIDNDRGFVLVIDRYEYTWERDTSSASGFVLVNVRGSGNDMVVEQPVGFAYESEDQMGRKIRSSDLTGYFDGQIAHKNMLVGVLDEWSKKRSSLDFRKFRTSSSSPVMGFDQPALPDVVRKYNKPMMWVHHSVLAPQANAGRLNYLLHEYGYDFNTNGCFDEFGHNKLLLPVLHGGVISALVYIEYSPDTRDGVPMISVGRYFIRQ
ncbi:MAG: hypothetical protein HOP32_11085 [Nitrospira sp.]|nr:hypothetical protein [Nitrospira sp.]